MTMLDCIKTGCHVFLSEYGEYAYGDAFRIANDGGYTYVFRLCERSHKPIRTDTLHFIVHRVAHWFDDERTSQSINSTMIAEDVTDNGYHGIPLDHSIGGTG